MNDWILVGIGLILTVGTGLFVAAEFALVNLDRGDLEARQERGEQGLGGIISALKITSTHLSSAQLGITLTTLLSGYTFEPAISSLLQSPLDSLNVPESAMPVVGSVVGVGVATLFSMVIGELVPKNFALALPLATARLVVPFQAGFTAVFRPVVIFFNNTANTIVRRFGIEPKEELSGARSAEELSSLIRRSAMEGVLDRDQAILLSRTLRFSSHAADEVMTPRVRMVTVPATATVAEIVDLVEATGHSRFPVTGESVDDILGVVHVKQAMAVDRARWSEATAGELMSSVLHVPESIGAESLLGQLRESGFQIAIVNDEYGGTAGLVTLEDLIEELVGELVDEHDRAQVGAIQAGKSVVFDASWRPDELVERTGLRIPESDDYETAAGFVAEQLGRMPELGDEIPVEHGVLRVERVTRSRLERLRYIPNDPEHDTVIMTTHDRLVDQIRKEAIDG